MPEVSAARGLVVRLEPLLPGPVAHGEPDRVAEVRRQQALLDPDHLVPTPGAVEPEVDTVVARREGILELVAVAVLGRRRHDRLERRLAEATDADERVAHLALLLGDLHVVGEILKAAAPADSEVPARRVDARRAAPDELRDDAFREAALHLRDPRSYVVARHAAPDEDDEPVVARDAAAPVCERVDAELELLTLADRRSHRLGDVHVCLRTEHCEHRGHDDPTEDDCD